MPTRPILNTKHPNGALSFAHVRVLAPPRVFAGVVNELTAIVGQPPIEAGGVGRGGGRASARACVVA
jgi:hypothetical protein